MEKKLTEDQLVNDMPAQEQPVPATQSEVAAAAPTAETTATPEAAATAEPASVNPTANPLEPPMPGMIPSGWVFPQDLAAAIETGDVTPAEVQQNVPDNTLNEAPQENVTAGDLTPEDDTILESLTREEYDVIQEYRLYRQKKLEEASENTAAEKACEECEKEKEEVVDKAIENDVKSMNESAEEEEDKIEEELEDSEKEKEVDPITETPIETVEKEEKEEIDPFEDIFADEEEETDEELEDLISYINDLGDDAEELPDALRTTADFLDEILAEDGEDDEEDKKDKITDEDDLPELEEKVKADKLPKRKPRFFEGIDYPAGSGPQKSEIVDPVTYPEEDQLVREYESKVRERKNKLASFREEVRNHRNSSYFAENMNDGVYSKKFDEALKGSYKLSDEKGSEELNSWKNNKFEEKYTESKKLNFKELLEKGLLG